MSDTPENATPEKTAEPEVKQKITLTCPKHGDVTQSALFLSLPDKDDPSKVKQYLYCLHCLNEILLSLQKEGAISTLKVKVEAPADAPAAPADPVADAVKKVIPFPAKQE